MIKEVGKIEAKNLANDHESDNWTKNSKLPGEKIKKKSSRKFTPLPLNLIWPLWMRHLGIPSVLALVVSGFLFTLFFLDPVLRPYALALDHVTVQFFKAITILGDSAWKITLFTVLMLGFAGLSLRTKSRRHRVALRQAGTLSGFILFSIVTSGITVAILKRIIGRARPKLYDEFGLLSLQPFSTEADFASFPSGHATTIFAAGMALAILLPRFKWVFFALMWWVALSRIFIVQHWASDVFGAFVYAGTFVYALRWWMARRNMGFSYDAQFGYRIRAKRLLSHLWPAIVGQRRRKLRRGKTLPPLTTAWPPTLLER